MPQTTEQIDADLKWAALQFGSTRFTEDYKAYREYYDGIQDMESATPKFRKAFGNLFDTFAYNRCGSVVDAIADRMKLLGMTAWDDEQTENEDANANIKLIWNVNRYDKKQGEAATEAFKTGDVYAIVWPESVNYLGNEEIIPKIYINNAGSVVIRYDDDTKKKLVAIKAWKTSEGKWQINFYYPDNIYKYVTPEKKDEFPKELAQLVLYAPDPELVAAGIIQAEPNPVPNPYNEIPVFHLANNVRDGELGRSELSSVIPLQDALNKACMDLMVAMEYGAYPQRYAIGLQLGQPDPATGKVKSPFKEGPGEIWSGPMGATFGSFDVANLTQFLDVQKSLDVKISNVSRIPAHWLSMGQGEFPSGEALKTADAPFVAKIGDRQVEQGQFHVDIFELALKMLGTEGVLIKPNWLSAELRSEKEMLDAAESKQRLGWSQEAIMKEFGLTDTQIEQMQQQKQDAVAEQQKQLSNGLGTGVPSGGGNRPPNSNGSGSNMAPFREKKTAPQA
jgi:hypothetical protein